MASTLNPPSSRACSGTAVAEPVLTLRGVTKRFSGIFALREVEFALQPGEIHALCGENGAGKSTLIKILSGVHPHGSFSGEYLLDGQPAAFASVRDSQARGLAVIYQELPLVEEMSVAANIFLGAEPRHKGPWPLSLLLDEDRMRRESCSLLARFGIALQPDRLVSSLGAGQKQLIEIARALRNRSRVLILDEPTAALTDRESESLLGLLRELRREGQSILYISHRLDEVMELADHITVLRDGQSVYSAPAAETTQELLVHKMVGRALGELFPAQAEPSASRERLLEVRSLSVAESAAAPPRLSEVSLDLHAGEIVGIYGLLGAGRSELLLHLYGAFGKRVAGSVKLLGKEHAPRGPMDSIAAGLLLVSEDRRRYGLVMDESLRFNLTLSSLAALVRHGLIDQQREDRVVEELSSRLHIKASGPEQPVRTLSGGNQQKVVLGKALLCRPKVVLLDEPTRGVDVGAKQEIYGLLNDLRREGLGVLMVSSDLPELLGMSDRVLVLGEGTLRTSLPAQQATPELLLHAAIGLQSPRAMSQREAQ